MNYIIQINDNLWFCGWDANNGIMKTTTNVKLAYRMRRPVADRTLPKVISQFGGGTITHSAI